jgi:hypothetical protein
MFSSSGPTGPNYRHTAEVNASRSKEQIGIAQAGTEQLRVVMENIGVFFGGSCCLRINHAIDSEPDRVGCDSGRGRYRNP